VRCRFSECDSRRDRPGNPSNGVSHGVTPPVTVRPAPAEWKIGLHRYAGIEKMLDRHGEGGGAAHVGTSRRLGATLATGQTARRPLSGSCRAKPT
jgi:hypothetical protein